MFREKRAGNNLYQELSFQEPDALGEIDEGADLTGKAKKYSQSLYFWWNLCTLHFVIARTAFVIHVEPQMCPNCHLTFHFLHHIANRRLGTPRRICLLGSVFSKLHSSPSFFQLLLPFSVNFWSVSHVFLFISASCVNFNCCLEQTVFFQLLIDNFCCLCLYFFVSFSIFFSL